MSLNGSGVFNVNSSGQPVQSGTLITAAAFNAFTADVATALSTALYKDGQQTATANQPMGGFKHTSVGDAVARNQYASAAQLQDGALVYLTSVSGTNTITASVSPTPLAYAAGQRFSFIVGTTNTGAATLNVSSLGAKSIKKKMSGGKVAIVTADLVANQSAEVFYDGTDFILETARTYSHGADVASASTIDLDAATGDCIDVTGTTGITAITLTEGEERTVRFTGALTLTHGASLVLPGAANITTASGDFAVFRGYASSVVRCVDYSPASGAAVSGNSTSATLTTPVINTSISGTAIASQADIDAGTATNKIVVPSLNRISLLAEQAATSGTSKDFTIPAGARRVTVMLRGVSIDNTTPICVRLGDAGGIESSGYLGASYAWAGAGSNATNEILVVSASAATITHAKVVLDLQDASDFTWMASCVAGNSDAATGAVGSFSKSLSQELTTVRVTTVSGTANFDAGTISVSYER